MTRCQTCLSRAVGLFLRPPPPPLPPPHIYLSVVSQISKKKLERVAVQGGDFGKAGLRTNGEMTVSHLRKLLEDDVEDLAKRFVCAEVIPHFGLAALAVL